MNIGQLEKILMAAIEKLGIPATAEEAQALAMLTTALLEVSRE